MTEDGTDQSVEIYLKQAEIAPQRLAWDDAIKVYHSAVVLVTKAIGQGVSGGAVVLNPSLVKYLERAGLYQPVPDDAGD